MKRLPAAILSLFAMVVVVTACRDDKGLATADADVRLLPTMVTHEVSTLISDSGITKFKIVTPVWYVYDEVTEPYWYFPEGLYLEKYDPALNVEATVRADSARYDKQRQIWQLDGNVDISSTKQERFLTPQLFWNQRQHKLYSDSFIHIERPDQILEGYGFDSNEQLTRYTIRTVQGIFPAKTFRGDGSARTTTPAPADTIAAAIQPSQP